VKDAEDKILTARRIRAALREAADPADARQAGRFFKSGPGEYGEGDVFIGVRVPAIRAIVRRTRTAPLRSILPLLRSRIHEERLLALLVMVEQYRRGGPEVRAKLFQSYMANRAHINNWDLVDTSAEHIVGAHLFERSRRPLHQLVRGRSLWDRRIGIMATFHFIRKGEFAETLLLAEVLLEDSEDLIHKAVGWMLREVGQRDGAAERAFLDRHSPRMPRTMLRYAIEKFPERERQRYLRAPRTDR
jgi:3-methyladenine DNA glycosylase AlkD